MTNGTYVFIPLVYKSNLFKFRSSEINYYFRELSRTVSNIHIIIIEIYILRLFD